MAFTDVANKKQLSGLVYETPLSLSQGFYVEETNITPPAAGGALTLGDVVFRAKTPEKAAAYAKLTAAAALVATNEFAIVVGDQFQIRNEDFVPLPVVANGVGALNSLCVVRGPIKMKEKYIKEALGAALTATQFETLRGLLKAQGIIVEVSL